MTSCCCYKLSPSRLLGRTDTSPMVGAHRIARILSGFWCCAQLCSAQRGAKRCPVPWSMLSEVWGPPAAPCRAHPVGNSHLGAWRGHALASCWIKRLLGRAGEPSPGETHPSPVLQGARRQQRRQSPQLAAAALGRKPAARTNSSAGCDSKHPALVPPGEAARCRAQHYRPFHPADL